MRPWQWIAARATLSDDGEEQAAALAALRAATKPATAARPEAVAAPAATAATSGAAQAVPTVVEKAQAAGVFCSNSEFSEGWTVHIYLPSLRTGPNCDCCVEIFVLLGKCDCPIFSIPADANSPVTSLTFSASTRKCTLHHTCCFAIIGCILSGCRQCDDEARGTPRHADEVRVRRGGR